MTRMVPPVPLASGSTPWMGHGCQGHLPFWTWPSMWSHQQVTGAWLAAGQVAIPGFSCRRPDWWHSRPVGFVANHGSTHSRTLAHSGPNEWPCFLNMLHAMFHQFCFVGQIIHACKYVLNIWKRFRQDLKLIKSMMVHMGIIYWSIYTYILCNSHIMKSCLKIYNI